MAIPERDRKTLLLVYLEQGYTIANALRSTETGRRELGQWLKLDMAFRANFHVALGYRKETGDPAGEEGESPSTGST